MFLYLCILYLCFSRCLCHSAVDPPKATGWGLVGRQLGNTGQLLDGPQPPALLNDLWPIQTLEKLSETLNVLHNNDESISPTSGFQKKIPNSRGGQLGNRRRLLKSSQAWCFCSGYHCLLPTLPSGYPCPGSPCNGYPCHPNFHPMCWVVS